MEAWNRQTSAVLAIRDCIRHGKSIGYLTEQFNAEHIPVRSDRKGPAARRRRWYSPEGEQVLKEFGRRSK